MVVKGIVIPVAMVVAKGDALMVIHVRVGDV